MLGCLQLIIAALLTGDPELDCLSPARECLHQVGTFISWNMTELKNTQGMSPCTLTGEASMHGPVHMLWKKHQEDPTEQVNNYPAEGKR